MLGGVVASLQLGTFERLGDRGGEAEVEAATRDQAFHDGQDAAGRTRGSVVALRGANCRQHAHVSTVCGGQVAERGGGAGHGGGCFEGLVPLHRRFEPARSGDRGHRHRRRHLNGRLVSKSGSFLGGRQIGSGGGGSLSSSRFLVGGRRDSLQVGHGRTGGVDELAHLLLHLRR